MNSISQKRAVKNDRERLTGRGLVRFEVLRSEEDRELIRAVARRLSEENSDAAKLRTAIRQAMASKNAKKGGILQALRRSPLVGAERDLSRPVTGMRKVDL